MQLGFVIDHSRCIGCHACTVACKSENDVPVGVFRTWVKYVEQGAFPTVKRSFAVLRCNQCSDAPCVTICPVSALEKRARDGIVDVDPDACIGCKACMQACPYDALYIHPDKGTAEKCHFCAHRAERGLAPACAVVCPTEAIVPGDFHDPSSAVSRLAAAGGLRARKVEAGTRPNVLYREANPAGLDPMLTRPGGSIWADRGGAPAMDPALAAVLEERARDDGAAPRTVYDVRHPPLWGGRITGYLFAKSAAAGVFMAGAAALPPWRAVSGPAARGAEPGDWTGPAVLVPGLALFALAVTMVLLVADLKRPERFLKILLRPNWDSWLARGSFVLLAFGLALTGWLAWGLHAAASATSSSAPGGDALAFLPAALAWLTAVLAALSASYTAWLFAQARGRVLWMKRGLALHLLAQAVLAGSAALMIVAPSVGWAVGELRPLRSLLLAALAVHLAATLLEGRMAPDGRDAEYRRTTRLLHRGPFAVTHWGLGLGLGVALPAVLLLAAPGAAWAGALAGAAALVGLWFAEDAFVRAGQALPIS